MALIKTLDTLRIASIGDNQPQTPFATPETPGGAWQQKGYLNDWDNSSGTSSTEWGGWQVTQGTANQVQAWYVIADPASGNSVRALVKYHVRAPRFFRRRRSNKTWEVATNGSGIMGMQYISDHRLSAPADDYRDMPIPAVNAPGGLYLSKSSTWTLHGYPQSREPINSGIISEYDAYGFIMMGRVVPHTLQQSATDGYRWADSTAQMNIGADHYSNSGWLSEHGHSAFLRLTNRYKLLGMMTIKRPDMSQPPGLTEAQFMESVFDWSALYPEEEIWVERGAHNTGTNKQTLVLRRTAPVSAGKTFALSVLKGTITLAVTQIVMSSGQNSVQFDVNTPGGAIAGQQVLYLTDGGTEDFWADFDIGSGPATGDPGGDPDSTALGNFATIGDSLKRGWLANPGDSSAPIYSPGNKLKQLLEAGGYTLTYVGTQDSVMDPGGHDVTAVGGWGIAEIDLESAAVAALNPTFISICIGTNNLGTSYPAIGTDFTNYANDLVTDIGDMTGVRILVEAPPKLSWFHSASYDLLHAAMQAWCAADTTHRRFLDLNAIGMDVAGADGNGDGTHWNSTGADKVATAEFNAIVAWITGTGGGPSVASDTTRTNRILQSTDLSNPTWTNSGDSSIVGAADGSGWQVLTSGTDYLQQSVSGFPANEAATFAIDAKPGNVDWALIRLGASDYSSGRFQFVNLATGAIGFASEYGAVSGASVWTETLSPAAGFRVCYRLTQPSTDRRISIRAVSGDQAWNPWTAGQTISVRRPQWQVGVQATNFIATTTAVVTRTLTTVAVSSASPVSAGATSSATVTLTDNQAAAWDRFSPIVLASSAPAILAVTPSSAKTAANGQLIFTVTAVMEGSATLTATVAGISSPGTSVTVGAVGTGLTTPNAPVVTVINSDTVSVNATGIDASATHVDILGKDLATPGTLPVFMTSVAKASLPVQFTDLGVNRTWRFQVQSRVGETRSGLSAATDATTWRLFVFGYIEPTPATTGLRVAAGRLPVAGILPTEIFGYSDVAVIDPGPYTYQGEQVSRIVLELTAQPVGGKIRNGDLCVLTGFKTISAGVSRFGAGLNYGAVVAEGS